MPRSIASLFVAWVMVLSSPAQAGTHSELEACLFSKINSARDADGIPVLARSASLDTLGRIHAEEMAAANKLYHTPVEELVEKIPPGWRSGGESVGYATDSETCDLLFDAFWESSPHRNRLLTPHYNLVGVGVFVDGSGSVWTTHVFLEMGPVPPSSPSSLAPAVSEGASASSPGTPIPTGLSREAIVGNPESPGYDFVLDAVGASPAAQPAPDDGATGGCGSACRGVVAVVLQLVVVIGVVVSLTLLAVRMGR